MTSLSELRDAIEDAEAERRRYSRGMFWIVVGGVTSVAFFVLGILVGVFGRLRGIDTGGEAGALIITSGIAVFSAWGTGVGWWNYYNHTTRHFHEHGCRQETSRIDNPTRRVTLAKRALRDAQDETVREFFTPSVSL